MLSPVSRFLRENARVIQAFSLLIAGLFAAMQWIALDQRERVRSAYEAMGKHKETRDYQALSTLEDLILSPELTLLRTSISNQEQAAEYRAEVFRKVRNGHLRDLTYAANGLNSLAICGLEGACDRAALCANLAVQMQNFRCNFRESLGDVSDQAGICLVDKTNEFIDCHCTAQIKKYLDVPHYGDARDNYCLYEKESSSFKMGKTCNTNLAIKH